MQTILRNVQEVLSAPGNGTAVDVSNGDSFSCSYKVENINTNVICRLDGSLNGTDYFTLITAATQTANGTYVFSFTGEAPAVNWARFVFVSELGGTAATITTNWSVRHSC